MNVIKAPNETKRYSIFLAGSIEMGKARHWHEIVQEGLKEYDIDLLNPRRDSWDASWTQTIGNEKFRQQVEWELRSLETSDYIFLYFDPDTMSPVSLLEFGLYARSNKLLVCCPDGYWRKGNIEVACAKYGVPLINDLDACIQFLKTEIEKSIYRYAK